MSLSQEKYNLKKQMLRKQDVISTQGNIIPSESEN